MRLVLDTNAFIWWREDSPRLPVRIGDQVRDPDNDIVISTACLWEIAIKRALGKLRFPEDFEEVMTEEGFSLLPITFGHLRKLETLPNLHRDPFDRLLIAQALAERIPIVTADQASAPYGVSIVW